jgi:hypothetical protein
VGAVAVAVLRVGVRVDKVVARADAPGKLLVRCIDPGCGRGATRGGRRGTQQDARRGATGVRDAVKGATTEA